MVSVRLLWLENETGATAIEYALLIALVAIAMLGGLSQLGTRTAAMWQDVKAAVENSNSSV